MPELKCLKIKATDEECILISTIDNQLVVAEYNTGVVSLVYPNEIIAVFK